MATQPPDPVPPSWLPPPPPDPWTVQPPRRAQGRGWATVLVVGVVGLMAFAACGTILVASRDDDSDRRSARVDPPTSWDPAVEPIAEFVAEARDLEWQHPVPVRFLDEDAFVAEVTSEEGDLTDEDRASIAEAQAFLEALSLLPSGTDLFEAVNEAGAASILAFYSWETAEIVMRGRDMTPSLRTTLAHELTHALQDQHFDLGKVREEADELGNGAAFTTVVEGDAMRIEAEYLDELLPSERDEYFAAQGPGTGDAVQPPSLEGVPEIVQVLLGFPYAIGPGFVATVDEIHGEDGIDELFRPDVTEADVLVPIRYLNNLPNADVDDPSTPDGAEDVGEVEPFGAIGWFLMLSARLDPATALEATDGWDGDAIVAYEVGGRPCVAAALVPETDLAYERIHSALEAWVQAGPPDGAEVVTRADDLVLRACAASGATGPSASLLDATALAAGRTALFSEFLAEGAPRAVAWCVTNELLFDSAITDLFARQEISASEEALLGDRAVAAGIACAA